MTSGLFVGFRGSDNVFLERLEPAGRVESMHNGDGAKAKETRINGRFLGGDEHADTMMALQADLGEQGIGQC